jgi:hypothetical protein
MDMGEPHAAAGPRGMNAFSSSEIDIGDGDDDDDEEETADET